MTNFKAVLLNTKFDREYRNILRFDTRQAQEKYFRLPSIFFNAEYINFNAGSLLETTMIYRIRENESLNDILSKNYCIVQDLNENRSLQYYYYFIRNAMQDAGGQVKLWLELDIFQTYYIDLNFTPCNIQRAHLNRFVDAGDGKVKFDGGIDSKLFEREDVRNVAKRLTKRTRLDLYPKNDLGNWLNENVLGWLYIFIDPTHKFTLQEFNLNGETFELQIPKIANISSGAIPSNISVLCYPILKEYSSIVLVDGEDEETSTVAYWGGGTIETLRGEKIIDLFTNKNSGYSFIYAIKFSAHPPLDYSNLGNFKIKTKSYDNKLFIYNCPIDASPHGHTMDNWLLPSAMFDVFGNMVCIGETETGYSSPDRKKVLSVFGIIARDKNNVETSINYETDKQIIFSKNEIIGSNKNAKFNPKLLGGDYFDLCISDQTENGFKYDLQKLNSTNFEIEYTEPIVPDMTKKYIRLKNLSGIYIKETQENLTGFISTNDETILMPTSAYQSMIANNKNFFLQNSINRGFGLASGMSNMISKVATGNIVGAIDTALNTGANYIQSRINQDLSIDNLQNAPANIEQAKGNIFFETSYSQIGVIVEEYDILPHEKNIINDYMCLYGFTANFVDDLKKYDNIRKFYNYIQAEIEETSGINISNAIHDKFRQAFRNGVRFWNSDDFNFDKENYERWLENE